MSGTSQNSQSQSLYREAPSGYVFVVGADMVEAVILSLRGKKAPGSDNICEDRTFDVCPGLRDCSSLNSFHWFVDSRLSAQLHDRWDYSAISER